MKFISKEAQNLNIIATILNGTQQRSHIFTTSFCLRDFVQMANPTILLTTTLGYGCSSEPYYFEPNTCNTPNSKTNCYGDSEVHNCLEKN